MVEFSKEWKLRLGWFALLLGNDKKYNRFITFSTNEQTHQRVNHLTTYTQADSKDPSNTNQDYQAYMAQIYNTYGGSGVAYAETFLVNAKPYNSFWAKAWRYPHNLAKFAEFLVNLWEKRLHELSDPLWRFTNQCWDNRSAPENQLASEKNFLQRHPYTGMIVGFIGTFILKAIQWSTGWLPRMICESALSPFRSYSETGAYTKNDLAAIINNIGDPDSPSASNPPRIGKTGIKLLGGALRVVRGALPAAVVILPLIFTGAAPAIGSWFLKAGGWVAQKLGLNFPAALPANERGADAIVAGTVIAVIGAEAAHACYQRTKGQSPHGDSRLSSGKEEKSPTSDPQPAPSAGQPQSAPSSVVKRPQPKSTTIDEDEVFVSAMRRIM